MFLVLHIKLNTKIQNETLFYISNWWCAAYLTYFARTLYMQKKCEG